MLIDLDRAIARTTDGKYDDLLERCYWRRIEPGSTLVYPIALHIPGSGETVECRSVCGALCYLAACNWATVDELTRLEKRTAIAYHAAQTHVERGEAVAIVVDDSVILSNTDGAKFDARYDASTDRELLASLVANRDLKLWERATSYVVRGRMAAASSRSKCTGCAFLRQTGNPGSPFCDQYCHADLQTICKDRGMGCSDYYPRAALSRRTSERFVVVKAQDIWRVTPDDAAETDSVVPEAK